MKTDGVIFDLDGTLWDSCRVVSESWGLTLRRSFGAEAGPTAEQVRGIMGMTAAQITRALFSGYGERAQEVCVRCITEENAYLAGHSGDLYPGVGEMLAALSTRVPLFIVSNCLDGYIQAFLQSTGLAPCFRDFACEGATGLGKADNIRLICRRHGLCAPVYVGDTDMDEKSAAEAGCPFIHAAYGFGMAQAPAAVIHAPVELLALLEEEETHA